MIVLDASGSMWGQIDGEPKISIARRVLKNVLGSSEADLELGLMAYGHRKKGQCGDIELIIMPGAGNGPAIAEAVQKLNPLGKTPLSASVQMAAEALKYTEEKATIIVITDGIETCNADPCALGAALEAQGIDFTAHVVGFGLSAEEGQQVACLAEETGGLYVPAGNADALNDALSETVEEIAAAPAEETEFVPEVLPDASLVAPESVEIGQTITAHWQGPGERRDAIAIADPLIEQEGKQMIALRRLVHGDVNAQTLDIVAPVRPGTYELRYVWGNQHIILATRTIEVLEAEISLDAPATVEIARKFTVSWVGPGGRRDSIDIIDPTSGAQGAEERLRSLRLVNGDYDNRQVTLAAPAEPGFYRLQYYNGENREILATREIEVIDAEVSLDAPDSAPIGTPVDVRWTGPGARRDAVEVFDPNSGPDGKVVSSVRLVNGDFDNATVRVMAPAIAGDYVLRYYNGDNREVLARVSITIENLDVSLDGPSSVPVGEKFEVSWIGPGARRDQIDVFDPNQGSNGKVLTSTRLVNGDYDGKTVRIKAPKVPGAYILRYWNGDSRVSLYEVPITVE